MTTSTRFTAPVRRGLGSLSTILRRSDDPNSPPTDTSLCRVLNGSQGRGTASDLRRALLWLQQFEGAEIETVNEQLRIVGLPPIGGRPSSNAYPGDASPIGRNLDTTA